jgi:hypothetical protein
VKAPLVLSFVLLLLTLSEAAAFADSRAEEVFRLGREAMKAGDCPKAIPLFEESQRLDPGAGTLLNLGACHAELGRSATAYRIFGEALYSASLRGDTEQAEVARERREALLPKLASIRITVGGGASPSADLSVVLDGTALAPAVFMRDVLVDPGEHTLSVRAKGDGSAAALAVERKIVIAANTPGVTAIELPAMGGENAMSSSPAASATTTTTTTRWPPIRVIGAATATTSVIALGIATYFGVRAIDLRGESDRECPNERCSQLGVSLNEDARANGNRSTAFFIVGAAALATGVLLYWIGTPKPSPSSSTSPAALLRGGALVW